MKAQRRDRNEKPIRQRAEVLGFLWLENNASTKGRPDACLLRNGHTYWCEVKHPGEPFTEAQVDAFEEMRRYGGVPVFILTSPDDVGRLLQGRLDAWTPESVDKVWSPAGGRKKREHRPGYSRARDIIELCVNTCCGRSRLPRSNYCAKCAGEGKRK